MRPQAMRSTSPPARWTLSWLVEVLAVVRDLAKQGMTMIIVTHEINFARGGGPIVFMEAGRIVEGARRADACIAQDRASAHLPLAWGARLMSPQIHSAPPLPIETAWPAAQHRSPGLPRGGLCRQRCGAGGALIRAAGCVPLRIAPLPVPPVADRLHRAHRRSGRALDLRALLHRARWMRLTC